MKTPQKELLEVRCPFERKDKRTGQLRLCNNLCVKVYPPSSGETYCTVCKLPFDFVVDDQVSTSIRVKPVK